jgi:hypothetical protein
MAENGYRESYFGNICWHHKASGVAPLLRKVIVGKEETVARRVAAPQITLIFERAAPGGG